MTTRYACFEIGTNCEHCGQPVPVNGPIRVATCTSCFGKTRVSGDNLAGFANDFDEEWEGYADKQGSGGTLMGGGGTYKYAYYRMAPRCSQCKAPLPEVAPGYDGAIPCSSCGTSHITFPAPDWLRKRVPSAVQCYAAEREGQESTNDPSAAAQPVVMACPQCGGALSITEQHQRMGPCQYCQAEIYIPDPIWLRLHPVKTKSEWFLRFEGPSKKEIDARRRQADRAAEEEELRHWRPRRAPNKRKNVLRVVAGIAVLLIVPPLVGGILAVIGVDPELAGEVTSSLFVGLFILGSILVGTSSLLGFAAGGPAKCKKALAELAAKHAWKHEGAEYKMTQGRIDEKIAGRDVEIDPDDDYAIEVELHDSPFDLKTDPQWSSPRDGLQRFSTGDPRFDNLFPIRYATPELVARMAESPEPLAPIYWFLDRWEPKIANMKIDWSEVGVHLLPGGLKADRHSTRYLEPQDVEPLLEDMLVLAKAIDAVAHGRTPELPRQRAFQGYRDPGQALRTGGGYGGAGVSMNARHS